MKGKVRLLITGCAVAIVCALSALSVNAQEANAYVRENNAPARAPEKVIADKSMISDDIYSADKDWWEKCTLMDAYKNPKAVTIEGKNAIHPVDISHVVKENRMYAYRNQSANNLIKEQIFKANFTAKVDTKEDIDFLRKLGEEGYSYTVRLYSGKESFEYAFRPEELKKFFQWNQ